MVLFSKHLRMQSKKNGKKLYNFASSFFSPLNYPTLSILLQVSHRLLLLVLQGGRFGG